MRKEPTQEGRIAEHGKGLGTITLQMLVERTREIALINGRSPNQVNEADWDQARRELLGEDVQLPSLEDAQEAFESSQWDPAPGTLGHRVEGQEVTDEQTVAERLVEEGVEEAQHDEMVEGTRESLRRERT